MGEMIKYGIKIAISTAVFTAFFIAISALMSLIVSFTMNSIAGDILKIIANCLPLNSYFWTGLLACFDAIIAFLMARKVYQLYSKYQMTTN